MDNIVLFTQLLWMLLSTIDGRNIYYERRFCGGKQLHEIFIRYNCTYHDSNNSYTPNESKQGITECCENPCTEHYIITRYCRFSNISQYTNGSQMANHIFRGVNSTLKYKSNTIVREKSSREEERNPTDNKVRKVKKVSGRKLRRKSHSHERFRSLSLLRMDERNGNIKKGCECSCRKRRAKINQFQYKPAVVVIKQTNTPVPIPIRRNYVNTL